MQLQRTTQAWAALALLGCSWASPCAALGQESVATGPQTAQQTSEDARSAIFARTPAELPAADAGKWKDWLPEDLIPEALGSELQGASLAYFRERDYAKALGLLYALLEKEPDFPPATYQMGTIYFRMRRYGDCAEAMGRFFSQVPSQVAQTQVLAHAHYSLGEYEKARDHYTLVLEGGNQSVESRRGLGLSHMRLGEIEPALKELNKVVEVDPEHGDAWTWIARILYEEDRVEEALEPARKGTKFEAYEPRPWFVLSRVLFELGRDKEADSARERFDKLNVVVQETRNLQALLVRDPRREDVLRRLLGLYASVGDVDNVREILARMYMLKPQDCELRKAAIQVLLSLDDREGAKVAARSYESTCGDDPATWQYLQEVYGKLSDVENQIRCGERYLRIK